MADVVCGGVWQKNGTAQQMLSGSPSFCTLNSNLFGNCATWADICACAALGAHVRVNGVMLAFGDSPHRALVLASAASDTIVRNYVSHTIY